MPGDGEDHPKTVPRLKDMGILYQDGAAMLESGASGADGLETALSLGLKWSVGGKG